MEPATSSSPVDDEAAKTLASPSHDDRLLAMLAHILQIVSWFVGPLVIFLVKRESRFVRFHALQALIWQAFLAVLWVFAMMAFFATVMMPLMMGHPRMGSHEPPVGILMVIPIFWLLGIGGWALNVVLGIVYGIKANNAQWASYPIIGKWAWRFSGK